MPTDKEIKKEIADLKEINKHTPPSALRKSEELDAQLTVLDYGLDEEAICDTWPDPNDLVRLAALNALDWANGELHLSPSEVWKGV